MVKKLKVQDIEGVSSTIAKSEDGTIQITLTVPFPLIKSKREEALNRLSNEVTVPGFRKGRAPISKVASQIPENKLLEETLQGFLPNLFADAVDKHKLKPAIYPKFELVKATEDESWQIRATTCEIPEIELGDYKQTLRSRGKKPEIWVPGKNEKEKGSSKAEKEQQIIKILLESIKVKIPKILIDDDVNYRLSGLLQRIEKLGLSLDSYLASIGKTAETLRTEYEKQASDSIALTLILNKIAQEENIKVDEKEVDRMIKASATQNQEVEFDTPEQRKLIRPILARRAVLDSLATLL